MKLTVKRTVTDGMKNYSYNHGIEGSQLDLADEWQSAVENNRVLSEKGLLGSLLLANGVPMLLAGDEFGNTQYGNNNAYCQDNRNYVVKSGKNFNQTYLTLLNKPLHYEKNSKFATGCLVVG